MKRLTLGLVVFGSLLGGCAGDEECLPGDADCFVSNGSGKADGFEGDDDPRWFASQLKYKLTDLPKTGKLTKPVWKSRYPNALSQTPVAWADTYWPTMQGSHNNRWQGATTKSPMEKYDAAFNNSQGCETQPSETYGANAKTEWDRYYQCAGPAAKWQQASFQGGKQLHDGIDNDNDGKTDVTGEDGTVDGLASWWGTCHAWAPAALMLPEPQHAVTVNSVKFDVADIKALAQNVFDESSAVMLGGRCNNKEIKHDPTTPANDDCSDVNPGAFHVVLTNFLGLRQAPLVEDRTANYEVWNQPMLGYEITKQAKITKTAANTCVGNTSGGNSWSYNRDAKDLYEVRVTVTYLSESGAEADPVGWENNTSTDDYHYILELNSSGKVIGGRYCTDSSNDHVDFLWSPTGQYSPSNPHIDIAKVRDLIKKSVE